MLSSEGMDAAGEGRICPGAGGGLLSPAHPRGRVLSAGWGRRWGWWDEVVLVQEHQAGARTSPHVAPGCAQCTRASQGGIVPPPENTPASETLTKAWPSRAQMEILLFYFCFKQAGDRSRPSSTSGRRHRNPAPPQQSSSRRPKKRGPGASPSPHQPFSHPASTGWLLPALPATVWAQMEMLLEPLRDRELG